MVRAAGSATALLRNSIISRASAIMMRLQQARQQVRVALVELALVPASKAARPDRIRQGQLTLPSRRQVALPLIPRRKCRRAGSVRPDRRGGRFADVLSAAQVALVEVVRLPRDQRVRARADVPVDERHRALGRVQRPVQRPWDRASESRRATSRASCAAASEGPLYSAKLVYRRRSRTTPASRAW